MKLSAIGRVRARDGFVLADNAGSITPVDDEDVDVDGGPVRGAGSRVTTERNEPRDRTVVEGGGAGDTVPSVNHQTVTGLARESLTQPPSFHHYVAVSAVWSPVRLDTPRRFTPDWSRHRVVSARRARVR